MIKHPDDRSGQLDGPPNSPRDELRDSLAYARVTMVALVKNQPVRDLDEQLLRIDRLLSAHSEKGTTTNAPHSIGVDAPTTQTVVVSDDKRETPRTDEADYWRAMYNKAFDEREELRRELNAARSEIGAKNEAHT